MRSLHSRRREEHINRSLIHFGGLAQLAGDDFSHRSCEPSRDKLHSSTAPAQPSEAAPVSLHEHRFELPMAGRTCSEPPDRKIPVRFGHISYNRNHCIRNLYLTCRAPPRQVTICARGLAIHENFWSSDQAVVQGISFRYCWLLSPRWQQLRASSNLRLCRRHPSPVSAAGLTKVDHKQQTPRAGREPPKTGTLRAAELPAPMVHYQQVHDAWVGVRNPDGR